MDKHTRIIETLEHWKIAEDYLINNQYKMIQDQYDINHPEGYQVRFWASGKTSILIITHSSDVEKAIKKSKRLFPM